MRKLTVFLKGGKNVVHLDELIKICPHSTMRVKNASVYWNFHNIVKGSIFYVTASPKSIPFEKGYWTFNMIKDYFEDYGVKLVRNRHDNTCKIYSESSDLTLNRLGPLLGFLEDKVIKRKTWTQSGSTVDVNLGLRYVRVACDMIDLGKNFDRDGKRSKVFATFPITTDQSLNGTVSHYTEREFEAPITNGDHTTLEFYVDSNIGDISASVTFELYF